VKAAGEDVRRHNRALVLDLLATEGPRSRAELAAATGLTKATVSALVDELTAERFVGELDAPATGRPGRPATLVDIADHHLGVGLEIDVDHLGVCVTDLAGRVVARRQVPRDNRRSRPSTVITRVAQLARPVLDELRAAGRRTGAATLSVPGLVDPRSGLVVVAPNLGWTTLDLASPLAEALDLPVACDNEADVAAVAELHSGRGRHRGDFVRVSAGVGIGAGVVLRGEGTRGAHGFAGELGHFVVEPRGPRCPCGNRGCLERYVGTDHLPPAIRPRPGEGSAWTDRLVIDAERRRTTTLRALDQTADRVAQALIATVHLLDPETVILGGWLAPVTPWLAPRIGTALDGRVLGARWAAPAVVASDLGPDAALRGAAITSARRLLGDPVLRNARRQVADRG